MTNAGRACKRGRLARAPSSKWKPSVPPSRRDPRVSTRGAYPRPSRRAAASVAVQIRGARWSSVELSSEMRGRWPNPACLAESPREGGPSAARRA